MATLESVRRRGIDITTTPEAGLLTASDEEQTAYALAEGRVIFTLDKDFLRINAAGIPHAGIVYCRQGKRGLGGIIPGLTHHFLQEFEPGLSTSSRSASQRDDAGG